MESLVIEGKNYISSKRAAEVMGYTQDYVGQLARSRKISARRIGGVWYVSEEEFSGLSKEKNTKDVKKIDSVKNLSSIKVDGITNKNNIKTSLVTPIDNPNDKNKITLDGVDYISSRRAAKIMGYTQDYIGQLCRGGKIEARQVGRGWYIPELVVLENVKAKANETQESRSKKTVEVQEKALEDILMFKKDSNEIPIRLNKLEEEELKYKDKITDKISPSKEIRTPNDKLHNKKEDYFYPSFLSATYLFDDTPLIPTPVRTDEPISSKKDIPDEVGGQPKHNVVIRRMTEEANGRTQRQDFQQGPKSKRLQTVTHDILRPQKNLALRSPMSLIKVTSMGVGVLLFASVLTFVPSISIFSSDTGVLKTVLLPSSQEREVLRAEVATTVVEGSFIESIISGISSFFESNIEYKSH